MAFMIAIREKGQKDRFLTDPKSGSVSLWTVYQADAFQTERYPEVEEKFQDILKQIESHELGNKPASPLLKQAFSKGTGSVAIVESTISTVVARAVTVRQLVTA
jgi:hypothetical protein